MTHINVNVTHSNIHMTQINVNVTHSNIHMTHINVNITQQATHLMYSLSCQNFHLYYNYIDVRVDD